MVKPGRRRSRHRRCFAPSHRRRAVRARCCRATVLFRFISLVGHAPRSPRTVIQANSGCSPKIWTPGPSRPTSVSVGHLERREITEKSLSFISGCASGRLALPGPESTTSVRQFGLFYLTLLTGSGCGLTGSPAGDGAGSVGLSGFGRSGTSGSGVGSGFASGWGSGVTAGFESGTGSAVGLSVSIEIVISTQVPACDWNYAFPAAVILSTSNRV